MKHISNLSILKAQGKQYIPDPTTAQVPGIFRGRPIISTTPADNEKIAAICPMQAIGTEGGLSIDLGKCAFCGLCARQFPDKITFTKDYKMATTVRENLIVREGIDKPIEYGPKPECAKLFKGSLKLRQVSAGGDNSCEWELGATGNVNFDMGRYGIEFVASPRHADGIVITGPITANMARATQICFDAVPEPRLLVLCGVDAISGGLYADSEAIDRSFLETHKVDLYLPGNPAHPLTILNGLRNLTVK